MRMLGWAGRGWWRMPPDPADGSRSARFLAACLALPTFRKAPRPALARTLRQGGTAWAARRRRRRAHRAGSSTARGGGRSPAWLRTPRGCWSSAESHARSGWPPGGTRRAQLPGPSSRGACTRSTRCTRARSGSRRFHPQRAPGHRLARGPRCRASHGSTSAGSSPHRGCRRASSGRASLGGATPPFRQGATPDTAEISRGVGRS
jgi:hypothetical protein